MKVQSPTDEFNPLRAVSSGSDLARSIANAELHFLFSFYNFCFKLHSLTGKLSFILPQMKRENYKKMQKNTFHFLVAQQYKVWYTGIKSTGKN